MFSTLGRIFLSFLTTPMERIISSAMVTVVEDFAQKGRQTLLLVMGTFVLSLLLSAGIILSLIEASSQYDTKGGIYFSALLSSSLILSALSLIGLITLFWPRKMGSMQVEPRSRATVASSPMEEMMAAVVAEGVQYFKNRQDQKTRPRNYSQA